MRAVVVRLIDMHNGKQKHLPYIRNLLYGLKIRWFWRISLFLFMGIFISSSLLNNRLMTLYNQQASIILRDRNGVEIMIQPNPKGQYMRPVESMPSQFENALIAKEDRFFSTTPALILGVSHAVSWHIR